VKIIREVISQATSQEIIPEVIDVLWKAVRFSVTGNYSLLKE
jgi:hypothetical protein